MILSLSDMLKYLTKISFLIVFSTIVVSCQDDDLGYDSGDYAEGETTVNLETAFTPFAEGKLTRASKETAGDKFNDLTDLVLLVYDKDGNILKNEDGELIEGKSIVNVDLTKYKPQTTDRNPGDAGTDNDKDRPLAENQTLSVSGIPLRLPFGEYYIVAVANIGQYKEEGSAIVTDGQHSSYYELTEGAYKDQWNTLDGIRKISVHWDKDNNCNNRQMLGYFDTTDGISPTSNSSFKKVKLNKPNLNFRAWLRRCVSKITIDFDGSNLRENVYIYIKDAKIYDLAGSCTLGFGQPQTFDEDGKIYNNTVKTEDGLIQRPTEEYKGDCIIYGNGDDYSKWPEITRGHPHITDSNDDKIDFHTQVSNALFFYENMQYPQEDKEAYDRTMIPDYSTGGVSSGFKKEDYMPYGTYIEVTAYYKAFADGNINEYEIKYRFILGKDVTTNYEAERNYHYKLTLKFLGNANEYHWQIDHDQPEGFDVPNPWYVSYLYNHDAILPFKYTPPSGYEVTKIEAEITHNPWYPTSLSEDNLTNTNVTLTENMADPTGDYKWPYDNITNKNDGNGFLSLRETTKTAITYDEATGGQSWVDYNTLTANVNEAYYKGDIGESGIKRNKREYFFDGTNDPSNAGREAYSYSKDGKSYSFKIPLFTRAKVMVKQTGYSGNNPFVGYQRVGRIKLIATLKKKNDNTDGAAPDTRTDTRDVNVVQARRVVNPKGVYRKAGSSEPFHVTMMFLSEEATNGVFKPVTSRGPWSAEIIGDKNFITLDGKQKVSGSTGDEIDFNIRFNRIAKNSNQNAVVRIKYHNYTCTHLIFVRRGYDAQTIAPDGQGIDFANPAGGAQATMWNTCNMIAENKIATDPRDEGSMFKWGNSKIGIDTENNAYKIGGKEVYYNLSYEQFKDAGYPTDFIVVDENGDKQEKHLTWNDIKKGSGFEGEMAKAADMRDFERLYLTPNINFGYGVLYADGATETQSTVTMAYGYHRGDSDPKASAKGMRGMFAYYWDREKGSSFDGRNIFFPMGRSGYGHRKNSKEALLNDAGNPTTEIRGNGHGKLRYACARAIPYKFFEEKAPLFVNIFRKTGAIYWARETQAKDKYLQWEGKTENGTAYGLDINYFSFDVNAITGSNIDNGEDACYVRTVK